MIPVGNSKANCLQYCVNYCIEDNYIICLIDIINDCRTDANYMICNHGLIITIGHNKWMDNMVTIIIIVLVIIINIRTIIYTINNLI